MAKVTTQKISDQVAQHLELLIIEGTFVAGEKLSSERDLATQYGVSRPSIRDAIKKLEAKGLVTRKQGGGTFISSQLNSPFEAPLFELLANNPESHYDLLEFRFALEGVCAYYAALRGTPEEFEKIKQIYLDIEENSQLEDLDGQSQAVVQFYIAIAEASHNVLLIHLLRGVSDLLQHNVKENLQVFQQNTEVKVQLRQHRSELMNAIVTGEPGKARAANRQHLAFIEKSLLSMDHDNNRIKGSVRRLLDK